MSVEFHELHNTIEVADVGGLNLARARALADAVQRHRDYTLISLVRCALPGSSELEGIIADIETDGVPPKNPHGIQYRERVVLWVPESRKELVQVWALRKDFPILMHQNQGVPGAPASLCLYFEPTATVLRTWTPQNFLRRIQWWIERAARGELHPADQPVEQLFFSSKYELVLPWDLDESRDGKELRLAVFRGVKRPDGGLTFFIEAVPEGKQPETATIAHVELTLEPIVHGSVESDPPTLGSLADMLSGRGVDLVEPLKLALQQRISPHSLAAGTDETYCVILLRIPVCRMAGAPPERFMYRAFMLLSGTLKLGEAIGAYFVLDGKYFSSTGLLGLAPCIAWRDEPVLPMEVLRRNSTGEARRQSGIEEPGPAGVLIGAGSLGSAMLNLWGRSGWGQWTVIDSDHVKPHNLSRHVAFSQHVGDMKATVASKLHEAAMYGASEVHSIVADACDLSQKAVVEALETASLIVDASTTLEYPRLASTLHKVGRHASVFVTPNGNAAVLLAEDNRREILLRTLEAQYYRAIIRNDWGKQHLDGNLGTFWSGASCRDISMVLPYSRIMAHASTLAEQVRVACNQSHAVIRAWDRDPITGSVTVHDIDPCAERRFALGDLDLFIDTGLEHQLREMRIAQLPNETGGVLLGYYDFNVNAVVVVDALPAPPDSRSSPQAFERGITGLAEAVSDASKRTAGIVGYIGEWHSHPSGHSASPSGDDYRQLVYLALGMADDGLPAVQLIVGESDIQVLQGRVFK